MFPDVGNFYPFEPPGPTPAVGTDVPFQENATHLNYLVLNSQLVFMLYYSFTVLIVSGLYIYIPFVNH